MDKCRTCKHWRMPDQEWERIIAPIDPDTYERMKLPDEVRECRHPMLLFCERPLEPNGFAVADGSEYMAALYTAHEFGCVRHEPLTD